MRIVLVLLICWMGLHAIEHDYKAAQRKACQEAKMVYVLITTPTCRWCRRFERTTLVDPAIKKRLDTLAVTVEVSRGEGTYPDSLKAPVVPMHYFLAPNEKILVKMPGHWSVEDFDSILNDAQRRFDNAVCTDG